MITLKELNPNNYPLSDEESKNIQELLEKINKIRDLWGKPMVVTSGVRSMADHQRIYAEKNAALAAQGLPLLSVPAGSQHLHAAAVDISDEYDVLDAWCQANADKLEEIGLWMEHPDSTKSWAHFQIFPPRSGKRFFFP